MSECSEMSFRKFRQLSVVCENPLMTTSVSGPVVIGENMRGVAMYELVRVGHDELVGGMSCGNRDGAKRGDDY